MGADTEMVVLEAGIHGEEQSIGVQSGVVLVDQHRMHCDVCTGGVPERERREGEEGGRW